MIMRGSLKKEGLGFLIKLKLNYDNMDCEGS